MRAALGMLEKLEEVNSYLRDHLGHEFHIGIGIHFGTVVVGEIGFHLKKQFTAIGDVVNVASRIESENKALGTSLLISEAVRSALPGGFCRFGKSFKLALRGKTETLLAHEVLVDV